jgi:hypothetical protein
MDPFSIAALSAAAAAAGLSAYAGKSVADEIGQETQLAAALQAVQDTSELVPVVVLHVRHVEMAPRFEGERLSIHAKYGYRGKCLRCDIARFSPKAPMGPKISRKASYVRTELGSTCLFLSNDHVNPVIRFSVRSDGRRVRNAAKTSISLAELSQPTATELPLRSRLSDKPLGRISVICELVEFRAQDLLKTLADVRADNQTDAYLISCTVPAVAGELVVEGSSDSDNSDER